MKPTSHDVLKFVTTQMSYFQRNGQRKSLGLPNGFIQTKKTGMTINVQIMAIKIAKLVKTPKYTVGRTLAKTLEANPTERINVEVTSEAPTCL